MTMAVNPLRGYTPKPIPNAFWWEGPAGNKVLAWNGFHYLWGRSIAKLGDWRFVDQSLPPIVARLEADEQYPFDFMYAQSTHPIRVDNGPPDPRMPDFVRDWNAQGRTPRIEFTTPAAFNKMLREHYADHFPTLRGDWLDWWSDGVASSAFETGVSRATHEQLLTAETDRRLAEERRQRTTSGQRTAPPTPTSRPPSTTSTPGAHSPASTPRTRSGPAASGTAKRTSSTPRPLKRKTCWPRPPAHSPGRSPNPASKGCSTSAISIPAPPTRRPAPTR